MSFKKRLRILNIYQADFRQTRQHIFLLRPCFFSKKNLFTENKAYLCRKLTLRFHYMNERLKDIKAEIQNGNTKEAIKQLNLLIESGQDETAYAYYLLGNAYRKQGNWQQAMNHYQEAISLDPDSPAKDARNMIVDILDFYNKDMFNQ